MIPDNTALECKHIRGRNNEVVRWLHRLAHSIWTGSRSTFPFPPTSPQCESFSEDLGQRCSLGKASTMIAPPQRCACVIADGREEVTRSPRQLVDHQDLIPYYHRQSCHTSCLHSYRSKPRVPRRRVGIREQHACSCTGVAASPPGTWEPPDSTAVADGDAAVAWSQVEKRKVLVQETLERSTLHHF